jgi:hypothetical protein
MTKLEELKLKNQFNDRLTETELNINKLRVLVNGLLQEFDYGDEAQLREAMGIEASTIITKIEIIYDYVLRMYKDINNIQEELCNQSRELRKAYVENGEINELHREVNQ